MAISKVVYGNDTLIDITDSTVDASNMLNGTVGYSSAGDRTVGTYVDSDEKVKQENTTTNADYRVLFSNGANDTTETKTARKSTKLKFNPNSGNLVTTKLNGNTVPTGTGTIALTSDIPTIPGVVSTTADGLAPMITDTGKYLKGDGTWSAANDARQYPTPSTNADYRVLFSSHADDTDRNSYTRKDTDFKYNPSTNNLMVGKINGNTAPTGTGTIALTSDIPTVNNKTIKVQVNSTDFTNNTFTLNQSSDKTIDIPVTKSDVGLGNVPNVTTNNQTPTFSVASSRANIASGEKLSVIFGKIMKWFTDLKDLAFIAKDGTSSTAYLRGDGQWVAFPSIPTKTSDLTNDSGFVTTDEKVKQENTTTNADYRVLFSNGANDTTETKTARKSTKLKFNPNSGNLVTTKLNGNSVPTGTGTIALTSDIPAAQVNSDWNASSGVAKILNKPTSQSASSGGTTESLCTTGEKYTWNNKVNKAGDTMTGNLTLRRDSAKTDTSDPDTPAQLALQARWTDNSTGGAGEQKSSTGYIRAYPDRIAGGSNMVITPGGNMFIGSGEAANSHYNAIINQGSVRTQEYMYITSDNNLFINAMGNTIENRRGFRMDVNSGNPRIIPAGPNSNGVDTIQNNIGMIGHPSYKWKYGHFTYLNNNTVPVASEEGGDTLALKSELDWNSIRIGYKSSDFVEVCPTTCREIVFDFYGLGTSGSTQIPCYTSLHLTTGMITAAERTYRTGWYQSNGNGGKATLVVKSANNKVYAKFIEFFINTSDVPTGSCTAYYR